MTDPIKIIKNDHRFVDKLFKEYEALGDRALKTKEEELLPKTEKEFSKEELEQMGDAMEAFKEKHQ